ncbi:hypothetical protein BsWGS_18731 [Bradybaena similaris]
MIRSVIYIVLLYFCLVCTTGRPLDEIIEDSSPDATGFVHNDDDSGSFISVDGDMLLTVDQYNILYGRQNILNATNSNSTIRNKRKSLTDLSTRWPNRRIPYRIEPNTFSSEEVKNIKSAIDEWETYTCLRFPPATSLDYNYINFKDGTGCHSQIGMWKTGKQDVFLEKYCRVKGTIAHEIGHVIGFVHEQNRPDRDDYVVIKKENIISNYTDNFIKYSFSNVSTNDLPYDYNSIMHYGAHAFAKTGGLFTIVTKDKAFQNVIGQREKLSYYDIQHANLMYNC